MRGQQRRWRRAPCAVRRTHAAVQEARLPRAWRRLALMGIKISRLYINNREKSIPGMNSIKIAVIRELLEGPKTPARLRIILGQGRGLGRAVRELAAAGYVHDAGATVGIGGGPRAMLLREIAKKCNVEIVLRGSNEAVLSHMRPSTTTTAAAIAKRSGLSLTTVYRSIAELGACGAVRRDGRELSINEHIHGLDRFAETLQMDREARYEDDGAEAIYRGRGQVLWKAPRGCRPRGRPTGFSRFVDYGVEYRTAHDYQAEQDAVPEMEDVLAHAVCAAAHTGSRQEMSMCAVFYAKNRSRIRLGIARRKAAELGMGRAWADVEAYVGRSGPGRPGAFLPWGEFLQKAALYGVDLEGRGAAAAAGTALFDEIGSALERPLTAYVVGGENMRIKGLKESTMDCDLVVESEKGFGALARSLKKIGYRSAMERRDQGGGQAPISGVFEHESKPTVDLFVKSIFGRIRLSDEMRGRSSRLAHQNLSVGLLSNEDVFLLKAAACREGDLDDMVALVAAKGDGTGRGGRKFDWDAVWREILWQDRAAGTRGRPAADILDQLSRLAEARGVAVPFAARLRRLVIDDSIVSMLAGGPAPVADISALLRGGDVSDRTVRSRIDALAAAGTVAKRRLGRRVSIGLREYPSVASPKTALSTDSLDAYLQWRFMLRDQGALADVKRLASDLGRLGYGTIGQVDEAVAGGIGGLADRSGAGSGGAAGEDSAQSAMDRVQAARFCMQLAGALPDPAGGRAGKGGRRPAAGRRLVGGGGGAKREV